ncbi:E3 ubiquitin-protein ligase [Nymphaea thermarum]|nr:E3 ubiquitin-protein ligase [Nymphaea thermarum]
MAEEGSKFGFNHLHGKSGFSSGLAVLLASEGRKDKSQKAHLVSSCDDASSRSVEHMLEYIFDLPFRSIRLPTSTVDVSFVQSTLRREIERLLAKREVKLGDRDGVFIFDNGCGASEVVIDEASICGDIRISKQPLLVESMAPFSSARANACMWKGKWMYEVILETAGIQQLGWATVSCPFTDLKGVGDADDSYSYDGRRISKWNKDPEMYGQPWVVGDVIGCCIDLDLDEISFYRNGVSLGVAFDEVRKMEPRVGYYPAFSLSQGERCDLNFGSRPFRYAIDGFLPIQAAPAFNYDGKLDSAAAVATYLLRCLFRLVKLHCADTSASTSVDNFQRWRRFASVEQVFNPICQATCQEFFSAFGKMTGALEYIGRGPLMSFFLEVFGMQPPHDYSSLGRILDHFMVFPQFELIFRHVLHALACGCKTAPLVLMDCPYSGPYPYLALASYLLRREELMVQLWKSPDFEFLLEGLLSRKGPNKHDLQCFMPAVWWPGSCEDASSESSMTLTTTALSNAISKVEEMQREVCRLVIQFIPPSSPSQSSGSVFRDFLQNLILKARAADRKVPAAGLSSNSVLVSVYTVILHFLSEGFGLGDISERMRSPTTAGSKASASEGFLHRGGQQSFPIGLFLRPDPLHIDFARLGGTFSHLIKSYPINDSEPELVQWEEGSMDSKGTRVTHSTRKKPCCCASADADFGRVGKNPIKVVSRSPKAHCTAIPERSAHVASECSASSLNDEIVDKPSSSGQSNPAFGYRPVQCNRSVPKTNHASSETLREEELLDAMLLLYHLGLAPNFKRASHYMSHQSQWISLLEETDKQIRSERNCAEQLKHLKEVRNAYREELVDCVRHCAWYRVSLFSRWKQRGMYAACMWIAQLLLVLSRTDSLFVYVPEFYLEALVDCFHALRRSDPPFVSSASFLQQGLSSFVTFVVTHFNDPRISSADLRDVLLHSISVLVQYKDYFAAFENNEAALQRMPLALLSAFDDRSWIPVTNILLRLCKGSGFGFAKQGESSSVRFQGLLKEVCLLDKELFSAFLNRLFNTLSWTITEFSVSIREMRENYLITELQQRKSTLIFDLSCNLARVLEFFTHEIPQAFVSGPDMNLRRLIELIIFILNQMTSTIDVEVFDMSIRRHGQSVEKLNRAMILAPLVGMILNLVDASEDPLLVEPNDIVGVFVSMDCAATVHFGFQYLLDFNWGGMLRGNIPFVRLKKLERFASCLRSRREMDTIASLGCIAEDDEVICCICYACKSDSQLMPCNHKSCFGCISRHLLNSQRCFFCNATVTDVKEMADTRL